MGCEDEGGCEQVDECDDADIDDNAGEMKTKLKAKMRMKMKIEMMVRMKMRIRMRAGMKMKAKAKTTIAPSRCMTCRDAEGLCRQNAQGNSRSNKPCRNPKQFACRPYRRERLNGRRTDRRLCFLCPQSTALSMKIGVWDLAKEHTLRADTQCEDRTPPVTARAKAAITRWISRRGGCIWD